MNLLQSLLFPLGSGQRTLGLWTLLLGGLLSTSHGWAQQNSPPTLVVFQQKQAPLMDFIDTIEEQTDFRFIFSQDDVDIHQVLRLPNQQMPVAEALEYFFKNTPTQFELDQDKILLYALPPIATQAQRLLVGTVRDQNQELIPEIHVYLKGTDAGTYTDFDGNFSLQVPAGMESILVFSGMGYETLEVVVHTQDRLDINLKASTNALREVVLTGYEQTVTQKDATGSISTVDGEQLKQSGFSNIDAAMGGQIAGLQVSRNSGNPGDGARVRIRGGTSVLGSNEPLYVVDGIPMNVSPQHESRFDQGPNNTQASSISFGGADSLPNPSPLTSIPPENIESITVLKDASATAIYGSRAANGVVLITTKNGRYGMAPELEVSYRFSDESPTKTLDLLDAEQWRELVRPQAEELIDSPAFNFNSLDDFYFSREGKGTDWQKTLLQRAPTHEFNLSYRGGSQEQRYNFALSHTNQLGILPKTQFKRTQANLRWESKASQQLSLNANLNFSRTFRKISPLNFDILTRERPDIPLLDTNGNRFGSQGAERDAMDAQNHIHPLEQVEKQDQTQTGTKIFGNASLIWKPLDRWTSRTTFNLDWNHTVDFQIQMPSLTRQQGGIFGSLFGGAGYRLDGSQTFQSLVLDQTLEYKTAWEGGHLLDAMVGVSFTQDQETYMAVIGKGFDTDEAVFPQTAANSQQEYRQIRSGLLSTFGRLNYSYQGKYLATLTLRRDASTKFSPKNRWGNFPSAALAWNLSEENFLKDKAFDLLKIRGSIGRTGSANFANFLFQDSYRSGSQYRGEVGRTPEIGNADIRWEKTLQTDLALEFSLWDQKLGGTLNLYQKNTDDLLLEVFLPEETGAGNTQTRNVGSLYNRGIEFDFRLQLLQKKNWQWQFQGNIAHNRTKLTALSPDVASNNPNTSSTYNPHWLLQVGQPIGMFVGYQVEGIIQNQAELDELNARSPNGIYQMPDTAPGDYRYADIDGNGKIDTKDQTIIGNPYPKVFGGFGTQVQHKQWSLNLQFKYSIGNDRALVEASPYFGSELGALGIRSWAYYNQYSLNYTTDILDAWSPTNPNGKYSRITTLDPNQNRRFSSAGVFDGSFLRLQSLQLSYRWTPQWGWWSALREIDCYAFGNNLWTWTSYPGIDPESNNSPGTNLFFGFDYANAYQTRRIGLGMTLKF